MSIEVITNIITQKVLHVSQNNIFHTKQEPVENKEKICEKKEKPKSYLYSVYPDGKGPETKYYTEYIVHFGEERWVSALKHKYKIFIC
jgi:hypothetical protein